MSHNSRGFTFAELLVALFVFALVSAATVPHFVNARAKARESEVKSNIHTIQIAIERYAVDTGGVYPLFSDFRFPVRITIPVAITVAA